jgi:predicted metal-dependent hydrolase
VSVDDVEVRRSPRRRRTVSAYRKDGRIVVLIPARFSRREEERWVREMVSRLVVREARAPRSGTSPLERRSRELSREYLDGSAIPASVRWVTAMRTRWASCTPVDATIRVSLRLQDMPGWVLDYVLVHELAHLLVPDHGPDFWRLVERYPKTERARGYLDGVSAAAAFGIADDLADDLTDVAANDPTDASADDVTDAAADDPTAAAADDLTDVAADDPTDASADDVTDAAPDVPLRLFDLVPAG